MSTGRDGWREMRRSNESVVGVRVIVCVLRARIPASATQICSIIYKYILYRNVGKDFFFICQPGFIPYKYYNISNKDCIYMRTSGLYSGLFRLRIFCGLFVSFRFLSFFPLCWFLFYVIKCVNKILPSPSKPSRRRFRFRMAICSWRAMRIQHCSSASAEE